jgi:hypothetical protein
MLLSFSTIPVVWCLHHNERVLQQMAALCSVQHQYPCRVSHTLCRLRSARALGRSYQKPLHPPCLHTVRLTGIIVQ